MSHMHPQSAGPAGLSRPREGRLVAGVCAGLARRFGLPRLLVRVLFVASMLLPGPQILIYLALWIIAPDERGPGRA
jgi:phage shock protein PspC (stress-responsive transcriptional regulator)